jgi:hypothetical protein
MLDNHLATREVREELGYKPEIAASMTWLLAEDFNTTGLNGDPHCYQDPPRGEKPRNDFYWFIRNVGRSGKSGADRGRWGLGKIVYPAASSIRSFYAYTVQEGSLRNLLIGRSVLTIHHIDGAQHDSEGYYGEYLDKEAVFFATPSEDDALIDSFRNDFMVRRSSNQPGLTIAIPFPDSDITYSGLIESILKHWFMVLIEGRLQVIVRCGNEHATLDNDTLEEVIERHIVDIKQRKKFLRQIRFAREVQDFDQKGGFFVTLKNSSTDAAPTWNKLEEKFQCPDQLDRIRDAYRSGMTVGLEVPVQVTRLDGTVDAESSFEVFIQRTDDPSPPCEVFLRDGMAIIGLGRLRENGMLAIIRAENNELGALLGDAENPAHTRWETSGKHFKKKYKYGASILTLVKQSAERISSFLTTSEEGQDKELLRSLFYLPEKGEGKIKEKTKSGGNKTKIEKPEVDKRKPYISLDKRNDGFVIRPHKDADRAPERLVIRAAYDVDRGNPFDVHHTADFDFTKKKGEIIFDMRGMVMEQCNPNRIVCRITDNDFEISAEGFDKNRDLIVNVRPEADISDEIEIDT